jgi:hypothetical protein
LREIELRTLGWQTTSEKKQICLEIPKRKVLTPLGCCASICCLLCRPLDPFILELSLTCVETWLLWSVSPSCESWNVKIYSFRELFKLKSLFEWTRDSIITICCRISYLENCLSSSAWTNQTGSFHPL